MAGLGAGKGHGQIWVLERAVEKKERKKELWEAGLLGVGWEIEAWKGRCRERGQSRKRLWRESRLDMGTGRLWWEERLMPRSLARQWGSPWTQDLCKPLIQVEWDECLFPPQKVRERNKGANT